MPTKETQSVPIIQGPWPKGMNNRSADHDLPIEACRNLVNIDLSDAGKSKRRKGSLKVYAGFNTFAGFSCLAGCFFVEDSSLMRLNDDDTATRICSLNGSRLTYHYDNGVLYLSDGLAAKKLVNGSVMNWGMPTPGEIVLYGALGDYSSGVYTGAVCYVDANGVESGASPLSSVYLHDNSGVVFTKLPSTSDSQVVALRLYLSTANGAELYHIADVPVGTASYVISRGRYDDGNVLDLSDVYPPPPGDIIRSYKGRKYIVVGEHVFYSEPFEPDHFRVDNTLQFPNVLTLMEPVEGGIFFATDKVTYFYGGVPDDGFNVTEALPYGAIFGTGYFLPDREGAMWQSQRGLVMGANDGSVKNLQEENVATESGSSGALLVRRQDGIKQAVAVINNPQASSLAATSFIEAEIIRRS